MSNSSAILWTTAHQASLSMGFSRQEYWSGLTFPSPGDLPDPGIEPTSPALQADTLTSEPPGKPMIRHLLKWNYVQSFVSFVSVFVLEELIHRIHWILNCYITPQNWVDLSSLGPTEDQGRCGTKVEKG